MNLKTEQTRYKVFLEDSYALEKEPGKTDEIWRYYELRGSNGYIYSYSPTELGVVVTANRVTEKVKAAHNWPVIQAGEDETTFKVPAKYFDDAAQFVKPRRKRFVDPAHAERIARFRFKPLSDNRAPEVKP